MKVLIYLIVVMGSLTSMLVLFLLFHIVDSQVGNGARPSVDVTISASFEMKMHKN